MNDIVFEIIRVIAVGLVFGYLAFNKEVKALKVGGWIFIQIGFALIFLGMLVDITDNYPALNKYVLIGDTIYESFFEKVIGYSFGFLSLAIGIWKWMPKIVEHNNLTKKELEKARSDVKVLSGLIPICSSCKNIRDVKGYWKQIEAYIHEHSEAEFSHGLCPVCRDEMMKELDQPI